MNRRRHLAISLLVLLLACDSDVNVVDGGGGSGATGAGDVGAGGSGGNEETGGMGGTGGEQPDPVPSCQVLQPRGAPYLPHEDAVQGALAEFSDDKLLIVVQTHGDGGAGDWDIVSGWVHDPFTTWPPTDVSPLVVHRPGGFGAGVLRSRSDGAFIYDMIFGGVEAWGGKSGAPGTFFQSDHRYRGHLQPDGEGYYTAEDSTLRFYATLTDAEPTEEINLPGPPGYEDQLASDGDGRPVVLIDGTFFTISDAAAIELGQAPQLHHSLILPREGGIWFAGQLTNEGSAGHKSVEVWAIDASGSAVVRPFGDAPMNQVGYGAWKDEGVVVAAANYLGEAGYRVAITDGVNVTTAEVSQADAGYAQNGISVAASPDGTSVYVGYLRGDLELPTFAIQRFDCVSP